MASRPFSEDGLATLTAGGHCSFPIPHPNLGMKALSWLLEPLVLRLSSEAPKSEDKEAQGRGLGFG